jgi:cholesterol oxidase
MGAPQTPRPGPPTPGATTLAFTEEMKGYCDQTESDYDLAFRAGRKARNRLMFHLTITATDVERFIDDPNHEAEAAGWVEGEILGGRRPVTQGRFNLFVDTDEGKRMFYRLPFTDPAGHPLTLAGFKEVRDDKGFDVWSDTSTLFTRILTEDDSVLATGILHIHPLDFARQLTTFEIDPPTRVDMLARFGALFAGELWDAYG